MDDLTGVKHFSTGWRSAFFNLISKKFTYSIYVLHFVFTQVIFIWYQKFIWQSETFKCDKRGEKKSKNITVCTKCRTRITERLNQQLVLGKKITKQQLCIQGRNKMKDGTEVRRLLLIFLCCDNIRIEIIPPFLIFYCLRGKMVR